MIMQPFKVVSNDYNFESFQISDGTSPSAREQTDPPTVAISELFPNGNFPVGQIMHYKDE